MKNQINIGFAGLGEFGSQLLIWLQKEAIRDINILYCIEPALYRGLQIAGDAGLSAYTSIAAVPKRLLSATDVIIDCATQGQGAVNKEFYQRLGLPAVFQNGETSNLCELFYASALGARNYNSSYLKIIRCSALTTCAVIYPLMKMVDIKSIWVCHFKINNKEGMLNMRHPGGPETTMVTGIPTHIEVVFLRGTSHNGYAYHGTIHLECASSVSRELVLELLSKSPDIDIVSEGIDTLSYPRGIKTLMIKESIKTSGRSIRLAVLAFTPEINFPQNEAAIRFLARRKLDL